jgi:hypothetical protein
MDVLSYSLSGRADTPGRSSTLLHPEERLELVQGELVGSTLLGPAQHVVCQSDLLQLQR